MADHPRADVAPGAGSPTRFLLQSDGADRGAARHVGDRVFAGARRRARGQGIHQIDLALAAPRRARRADAQPVRRYLYEASRYPLPETAGWEDSVPVPPHVYRRDQGVTERAAG